MRKWQKFLQQHPSLNSSSDEIEELPPNNVSLEAITMETKSVQTNTTLSLPSAFQGETIPPVDPNLICLSIIPRNCKGSIVSKDPNIHETITAMKRYYSRFVNDFYVKENVVWMNEKLVIPMNLQTAINNRIHAYHHGKTNMFDAAKDVWYPYIYRSIASIAEDCPECTAAGKN